MRKNMLRAAVGEIELIDSKKAHMDITTNINFNISDMEFQP